MKIELETEFVLGQTVWAVDFTDSYEAGFEYKVIGPARITWIEGTMTEPGVMEACAYALEGHSRHGGFYPDRIFATQETAQAECDRQNRCSKCISGRYEPVPATECESCPNYNQGETHEI